MGGLDRLGTAALRLEKTRLGSEFKFRRGWNAELPFIWITQVLAHVVLQK